MGLEKSKLERVQASWSKFDLTIKQIILGGQVSRILEVGAGRNPYLDSQFVEDNNLDYTVFDIDTAELALSRKQTKSYAIDLSSEDCKLNQFIDSFDCIFTHMVLEHVKNPSVFHKNCLKILKEDGQVVHFFATKYSVHTILNQLLPERLTDWLVFKFQTRKKDTHDKYKAYYRWCFGPTKSNIARLEGAGYKILDYKGFLGHTYLNKFKTLYAIEQRWNKLLLLINSPLMCSNAFFVAKKKDSKTN